MSDAPAAGSPPSHDVDGEAPSVLQPWEAAQDIAAAGDAAALEEYLDDLSAGDAARAFAHLSEADCNLVLETLDARGAADIIDELPVAQAADLIGDLPPEVAAAIVHELPSDGQADILSELAETESAEAEAIFAALDPAEAFGIRALAGYDDDVAGGLMATELLRFRDDQTVSLIIEELRHRAERDEGAARADDVQYAYVTDRDDRLVGVLRMRDLVLSRGGLRAADIMIREPISLSAHTPLDIMADVFARKTYLALPVLDDDGRVLGIVHRAAVETAVTERAGSDHLKAQGIVGGEELRTMPLLRRAQRRLSWLSVNIVLNVVAASVIAVFEETLAAVIALAFFLPIISDMSGCSGNQAVAVSIRELSLGLVKPHELLWVWLREIGVGLVNGAVLGLLIGVVAWLWKGNPYLGVVVGVALAVNTMIAVSIGGLVPLVLKRLSMDPALASGPVLTTITDICGFMLVLGLATLMLARLTV